MKRLVLVPSGWSCSLNECPPGLFMFQGGVCFKAKNNVDYAPNGFPFVGGEGDLDHRLELEVQPLKAEWEEI